MATEKTYIGNGRQREGSAYITIELDMNKLLACPHTERNGRVTVTAVLARKLKPNGYGTHALYIPAQVDAAEEARNALMDQQELEAQY